MTDNTTEQTEVLYKYHAYDSQLPIDAVSGRRVVKCLYKENAKTGKKAGINSYIQIPVAHITEEIVIQEAKKLAPYVLSFLQAEEDKLIKKHHASGGLGMSDAWFSLDKVLVALDEAGQGNRLNKEKIDAWFDESMREPLVKAFADKVCSNSEQPTEQELEKLAAVTNAYKAKFGSLASGKTFYRPEECEKLQKVLEVTEATKTSIGERFNARLESMKTTEANDLLLAL